MSTLLSPSQDLDALLRKHTLAHNLQRSTLITHAIRSQEVLSLPFGALATWNSSAETGRIPKDTYIVQRTESQHAIDWSSPTCIPMQETVFDQLLQDALAELHTRETVFVSDRTIGSDPHCNLSVRLLTDSPLTALFCENMFRDPADTQGSVLGSQPFTLIALPHTKVRTEKYRGALREEKNSTIDMCIAMDFDRRIGIVYGTAYCGAVKKLMFTVMNYLLPEKGVLPLHCSANEDTNGRVTLFLGLSGTGKTTLSNEQNTVLIGDDEHSWSDRGIANMENGCYAKLINLRPEKEPEIHAAVFSRRPAGSSGVILENAMVYPNGKVDVDDSRFTENSRASYPLEFLQGAKKEATGTNPETIIFLTADAHGVLPPVAHLEPSQAMLWFLMGYTSKLAGTEAGITSPVSAFSRFFGGPFMPRNPMDYMQLLERRMQEHGTQVYLVNTGWTGGPYGVGTRMDISLTRAIVRAIHDGSIAASPLRHDPLWKFAVPTACPGIDASVLNPASTWSDPEAYAEAAQKLANEFAAAFTKNFAQTVQDPAIRAACPGL